ncbi:phospho-2-dehydro-3-deoxyheptonate aldolase [Mangrovihabitans endophyticus]|uniref:Phospho-2-dehydro-3-deoxyheptonate aldolase n=2 Tax=Mangrovihabitans endophyticus TaxID=1751298 RepID=A0A8J3BTL5_9ACTN|nr:phospho-2-dehydro-3-deoxyheptonate aldolase [Mangrovihabitans endophyticus]
MTWAGPATSVTALAPQELRHWRGLPAGQQPEWGDGWLLEQVVGDLARLPGLVGWHDVHRLRERLRDVAQGRVRVVQAGDCAEDPDHCRPAPLARKVAQIGAMAEVMEITSGRPVLRVGRIAGQFAKPRSAPTERVGGIDLPAYRGHLVNGPAADAAQRRPDPLRLLAGYDAARRAMAWLARVPGAEPSVWTSHEALLLDYEVPLVRRDPEGRLILTSTHWPWIGERTRDPDHAHVRLLAAIGNPVACKVGPTVTPDQLLRLCAVLDPDRDPGRLTLVARMGADRIGSRLPALVRAVRRAGHPVIWLCDPMHGNTVAAPDGSKTRLLSTVLAEVDAFQNIVDTAAGLHLETTPEPVVECVSAAHERPGPRTSLCDPRLNTEQALTLTERWYR